MYSSSQPRSPVYGTTLVDHGVFVLGGDQEVLDGAVTFEVGLNVISTTDLFDTFTKNLCVGYDYVIMCSFYLINVSIMYLFNLII